jgi:hypothetical protein
VYHPLTFWSREPNAADVTDEPENANSNLQKPLQNRHFTPHLGVVALQPMYYENVTRR